MLSECNERVHYGMWPFRQLKRRWCRTVPLLNNISTESRIIWYNTPHEADTFTQAGFQGNGTPAQAGAGATRTRA